MKYLVPGRDSLGVWSAERIVAVTRHLPYPLKATPPYIALSATNVTTDYEINM